MSSSPSETSEWWYPWLLRTAGVFLVGMMMTTILMSVYMMGQVGAWKLDVEARHAELRGLQTDYYQSLSHSQQTVEERMNKLEQRLQMHKKHVR